MNREFYKGYWIEQGREIGERSVFSRPSGQWRAYTSQILGELVYEGRGKREMQAWLKANPPSKLRAEGKLK